MSRPTAQANMDRHVRWEPLNGTSHVVGLDGLVLLDQATGPMTEADSHNVFLFGFVGKLL